MTPSTVDETKLSNRAKNCLRSMLSPAWPESGTRRADPCLVMFSGGRDSTLAALKLHQAGDSIALITVTSGHLVGIDRVRSRIAEMKGLLPVETPWLVVRQPENLRTDTSFYEQTCLPCHHAYVVVSATLAGVAGARRLAFGYATYQSTWPEQTPMAISRLQHLLSRHGIRLELPVYDLPSREAALTELASAGLSGEALEQKCTRQVTNVTLDDTRLAQQIDLWERAIDQSMGRLETIELDIVEQARVGDFV